MFDFLKNDKSQNNPPETKSPASDTTADHHSMTSNIQDKSQASENVSPTSSPPIDYFDEWESHAPAQDITAHSPAPTAKLTRDEFIKMYCGGFHAASALTGFKSLDCSDSDPRCVEGFGALYETADEIPALGFMLRPTGKWLGRTMAMGMLFAPMVAGVAQEVALKKKPPPADFSKAKEATKGKEYKRNDGDPDPEQAAGLGAK